jgi:putative methyltransferase (TIGR04325 family)
MNKPRASEVLRSLVPPLVVTWFKRLMRPGISFEGPVADWAAAQSRSKGYDDALLIERVATATRTVRDGRAAFERDGVVFNELEFRFPVLAGLLATAAKSGGRLHVLDFGGALGSAYWQHRRWLEALPEVIWTVVEQHAFVVLGQSEFAGREIRFANGVVDADAAMSRPIILAGSVLQYLEHPEATLDQFAASSATALLIDRIPVSEQSGSAVCVQRVPKSIGGGSYPCTVFSKPQLLERLRRHWVLISELPCDEPAMRTTLGLPFEWRGFFLERRP